MQLHLANVRKTFAGGHRVLDDIAVRFDGFHSLALIGPSGGGKSTLLRLLAGLENPDPDVGCQVEIDGELVVYRERELIRHRRQVGVVFQAYNLFPHLSALRNVALPLEKVHGLSADEARDTALATLRRFGLDQHTHKRPAELSGGQRQRVAIARAIAIKPRLLLFDEPTSALDPEMTAGVLEVIEELRKEGRDFILVTHEMGFARQVADQVALLADGRIVESGAPESIFESPSTDEGRRFLARVLRY